MTMKRLRKAGVWLNAAKAPGFNYDEPIRSRSLAPGAVNIPLGQLRARLGELPCDRGYKARTVSGGMLSRATSVN
jgi:hypothetical protein